MENEPTATVTDIKNRATQVCPNSVWQHKKYHYQIVVIEQEKKRIYLSFVSAPDLTVDPMSREYFLKNFFNLGLV